MTSNFLRFYIVYTRNILITITNIGLFIQITYLRVFIHFNYIITAILMKIINNTIYIS